LPAVVPCTVALIALEVKVAVSIPAAAQFFARVAGSGPCVTKFLSHGSGWANSFDVEAGRKSSVTAGARIEVVLLPRNRMSLVGAQRRPASQVLDEPAIEFLTRRMAPSSSTLYSAGMSWCGSKTGRSVSA